MMKTSMMVLSGKRAFLSLFLIGCVNLSGACCVTLHAQPPAVEAASNKDASEPDVSEIEAAIADLSSVKFQKRQAAFDNLIEIGEASIDPLAAAASADDLEAGSRCVEALARIGADKSLRPAVLKALKRVVADGTEQAKTLAERQVEELSLTDEERAIRKLESFGERVFRRGDAPVTLLRIKKPQSAGQFQFFPSLRSVSLDGPMITDDVIPYLLKIPALSYLTMKHTSITDDGLYQLSKCRSIRSLTFQDREINETFVSAIYEFPGLQTLALNTRVDADDLLLMANLPKLSSLNLSNLIVSEEGIESLNRLHRVSTLSVMIKSLSDDQCKHLAKLTLPATLSISACDGVSVQSWTALSEANITSLSLMRCDIRDSDLAALAESKSMTRLSVYGGPITDEGLRALHGNSTLSSVTLQDTKATEKGVEELLAALPGVRRIRFNGQYVGEASRFGVFVPPKLPSVHFMQMPNRLGKSAHVRLRIDDEAIKLLTAEANLGSVFVSRGDPTDEEIARLKNVSMTGLVIVSAAITSQVLEPFQNHPSISEISITSGKVTDEIVDDLVTMSKLKKVSLSQTQLSDEGMQRLCKGLAEHDQLQSLVLSSCPELSNVALKEVGQLKGLTQLYLSHSPKIDVDVLEHVGRAKRLTTLRLSGVTVDGGSLESIEHLELERLHFRSSTLNDDVVAKIADSFPGLTQIGFEESHVTDKAMKSLGKLKRLKYIYLIGTKVSGDGLKYLDALKDLKTVYASRSEISPEAIKRFYQYHPNTNLELN